MTKVRLHRRGAVATEFAITAPIFFLIVFAAVEFCLANMMLHTTEAAAYEGARVAIIPGATAQEAEQAVRDTLATARIGRADIAVDPANLSQDTDTVSVTVSVRFRDNTVLVPFFMTNDPIVRTCVFNREKAN